MPVNQASRRGRGLFLQIVVMKGKPHLAGEIDQRGTKRDQRADEQQRHAILVGKVVERADERDNDDERSEYRGKN